MWETAMHGYTFTRWICVIAAVVLPAAKLVMGQPATRGEGTLAKPAVTVPSTAKWTPTTSATAQVTHITNSIGNNLDFPRPFLLERQSGKSWTVNGRVVDSTGRSLDKAHVAIVMQPPSMDVPPLGPEVLGETTTDVQGNFRMSVPGVPRHYCYYLSAIAGKAGYGFVGRNLDIAAPQQEADFRLGTEQPLHGRVLSLDDRPVSGVHIYLHAAHQIFWPVSRRPLAWPEPATTDNDGRFILHGISLGAARQASLLFDIDDFRFAPDIFEAFVQNIGSEEVIFRLRPPRIVEGIVFHEDTKAPMVGAWLSVILGDTKQVGDLSGQGVKVKTDGNGRFHAHWRPGKHLTIYVYPPTGEPYPTWLHTESWPGESERLHVEVSVPRGILVRGKVAEAGSRRGIEGAGVEYQIRQDLNYRRLGKRFAMRSSGPLSAAAWLLTPMARLRLP